MPMQGRKCRTAGDAGITGSGAQVSLPKQLLCLALYVATVFTISTSVQAQTLAGNSHLVEIRAGSDLSRKAQSASYGGFALSDGTPVSLHQWYSSNWTDIRLTWMTEINPNFGVFWGFSTGESGQKYRIAPGLKLGFLLQTELSRHSFVSASATTILGGMLTEDTCTADYGAIGGVQTVNCRLAASTLPPSETLSYLFDDPPSDRVQVDLRYQFWF